MQVVIDDRVPVTKYGSPAFARPSKNGAWWVPILEKAYSKLNMNYLGISGGFDKEAYRALTGMPVDDIKVDGLSSD